MAHPLEAIPAHRRADVFLSLLLLTFGLTVALGVIDQPLRAAALENGIVSLELAGSLERVQAAINGWDARVRFFAGLSLGLDYLYLVVYSTTIALACLWAAGIFRARGWALAAAGVPLAWGQWFAALCDAVENFALIVLLAGYVREPWPLVAFWAAVPKFALTVAGILYAITAAIVRLRR